MLNDIVTVDLDLSLERKTEYSLAKGLTLVDINLAREYFDSYKATTADTVDMKSKEHLNLKGVWLEGADDPGTIAFVTRLYIIDKAIEEFLPDRKDLLAYLFELIIFDQTVSDDYQSLDYESLQWSIRRIANSDDDLYFKYLSHLLVRLFEDESIGSVASRDAGLDELSFRKDSAIIPILKRLYNQPEHPFHYAAELKLYTAVENFPECFAEAEYLEFKETAKRVRARMLANSSS